MSYLNLTWIVSIFLTIVSFAYQDDTTKPKNFQQQKELIVLRKLGHEILLQSGDSTSRVLPVKKLSNDEYQLQFESSFTFQPDSLVSIVGSIIKENGLPPDYIVNVIDCSTAEIVYGYAIIGTEQNDIVPCSGRVQPKSCYFLNLKFRSVQKGEDMTNYTLAGISILGLSIFFFIVGRKKRKHSSKGNWDVQEMGDIQLGRYSFSKEEQCLFLDGIKIDLTYKEFKILNIFAKTPNQIINREILQKEVWENEGVIVGRSLDMYVSKLRKKLRKDTNIELINIHGKGYKLRII